MKGCKDCWHNYHCPIPQEGYDYNPDTCPHNPDNDSKPKNNIEKSKDNWYDEDGYYNCENCDTCHMFDGENCLMP